MTTKASQSSEDLRLPLVGGNGKEGAGSAGCLKRHRNRLGKRTGRAGVSLVENQVEMYLAMADTTSGGAGRSVERVRSAVRA